MNKLLFLLHYALFFPCALSADILQDSYKENFQQNLETDFFAMNLFLAIFIIICLSYIFSLTYRFKYKKKHKFIIKMGNIINTVHSKITKKDIDILRVLDSYLSTLHQKAAQNSNKVYFNFNQYYPRNVKMVHDKVCVLFYTLAEFVLEHTKNSHIFLGLRPKKSSCENSVKYEFYIKVDTLMTELEEGEISQTIQKHSKLIDIIYKNKKEIKNCVFFEYHKLQQSLLLSKILETKINFLRWQKHSFLSFELELEKSEKLCQVKSRCSQFFGQNTIILEDDTCSFYQISSKLKQFQLNIQPKVDLELAKEHLFSTIFTPRFVFINTRVLRSFKAQEIKEIEEKQAKQGFSLILISDSQDYDCYDGSLKNYVLLKNPINIETLLAAMNTPPHSSSKRF